MSHKQLKIRSPDLQTKLRTDVNKACWSEGALQHNADFSPDRKGLGSQPTRSWLFQYQCRGEKSWFAGWCLRLLVESSAFSGSESKWITERLYSKSYVYSSDHRKQKEHNFVLDGKFQEMVEIAQDTSCLLTGSSCIRVPKPAFQSHCPDDELCKFQKDFTSRICVGILRWQSYCRKLKKSTVSQKWKVGVQEETFLDHIKIDGGPQPERLNFQ